MKLTFPTTVTFLTETSFLGTLSCSRGRLKGIGLQQQKKKKKKGMATALPQAKCHFWLCSKDILFAGDLPGSSVAKTQCFHCRGHGLAPRSGNQDPTCLAVWPERKKDVVYWSSAPSSWLQALPRTPALRTQKLPFLGALVSVFPVRLHH